MEKAKEGNRIEPDMELILETPTGKLTGVFLSTPINSYQSVYTAWLKEKPGVIVLANNINEAIDELFVSLNFMLEVEKQIEEEEYEAKLEDEILKLDYRN